MRCKRTQKIKHNQGKKKEQNKKFNKEIETIKSQNARDKKYNNRSENIQLRTSTAYSIMQKEDSVN